MTWEIDTHHGITVGPCRLRMPEVRTAKNMEKLWAYAHLIAAAPDMLAALKEARRSIRLGGYPIAIIDAAIAKAERAVSSDQPSPRSR